MRRAWFFLSILIVCLLPLAAQTVGDESTVSFLVRLGLNDIKPQAWDGTLTAASGEVLNLRSWRPHPTDQIDGTTGWKLSTRQGRNFTKRPWEHEPIVGTQPYINVPGLIIDVSGSSATEVRFKTSNGSFDVKPFELAPGEQQSALDSAVGIERVPTAQMVSTPDLQNDYATLTTDDNGTLWTAWVAYADWKNHVRARRFDGSAWAAAEVVSGDHDDIFLVKAARDPKGGVWFVWSSQVDGNWDLYGRRRDGSSWSAIERLSTAPQPDIYHAMAADSEGNLWLVWQGFRNGAADIFARSWNGSAWSGEQRLSVSPANDWEPAIATDSKGRVWVAWDTYDQGNYDIVMSKYENGRWSELATVAATPKFEAHVSLACDKQDRLWATWNESGTQWGKDTGFLIKREGTRLYQSRWMAVGVFDGGVWYEPTANIEESLPKHLQGYNDLPLVEVDSTGRVWLLFRHRLPRMIDTPSDTPMHRAAWEIYATSYDGAQWTAPVAVPFTQGRTDMRMGLEADRSGSVWLAWPMDNRDYQEFLFEQADVYAARLPAFAKTPAKPELKRLQPAKILSFPLHPNEKQDLARIRGYAVRSGGKTYHIYRGDTHRHTEFSMDGNNDGSLVDTYRYSIDATALDYLMVSEHNSSHGPDIDYINWTMQQMADVLMVSDNFVPLYGYERSISYPDGHRNIIFAKRGNPTLPITQAQRQHKEGAKALYDYLRKYDGIAISHTSATGMGTDWRDNDPEVEPLVELYQGDRVSAEYEGAPRSAYGGRLTGAPGNFRPLGFVWNAWAKGYKLGVQVASDHLSTHISYACTIAEEFTREGLLDAMKKRHSYGATDNIILDYRLEDGDREFLQGDIVTIQGRPRLRIRILGTAPIRQIDIVKDNTFIHTRHPLERDVDFTYTDTDAGSGESYYYVRVLQADNEIAWSSPIWVSR